MGRASRPCRVASVLTAFARLDEREEDLALAADLSNLIADVARVAQTESEMSPEQRADQCAEQHKRGGEENRKPKSKRRRHHLTPEELQAEAEAKERSS